MGGLVSRWKTSNTQSPSNEEVREEDPVLTHSLGFAWVTLTTNDSYSLGALVLAHSLKNVNTAHKLAVLITPTVSASMREQLSTVFDVVKVVDVLDSKDETHLALLKRPELGITFTKIHCWRLIEFDKCVFLDADTLVMRNCDELFDREELSAAPDVGWPDCFNTGVFVYKPSVETFNNLIQFALQHGSFDGGDQGLLNQFFSDWATKDIQKHLPFVYNLTSVAVYSYMPAFKQYGSQIRIVHFIGTGKPWHQPVDPNTRAVNPVPGSEHLTPMLQIWWDIFCEKVHPSLAKNLDCGTNNDEIDDEIEACSNDVPVERETAEITIPITPYIEKDDSRQFNLPYHPFDVRSSSGELLNITYCEKREQEEQKEVEHRHDEQPKEQEEKKESQLQPMKDVESDFPSGNGEDVIENTDTQVPIKSYEEVIATVDTYNDEDSGDAKESATEDKQCEESPFTYDTFFPDETCVQNYLEHNVMTYHPFENRWPKPVVESEPEYTLPRFLTIAEDDVRQSLNVCHEDPQPKQQHERQSHSPPSSKIIHCPLENYDERSISRSISEENLSQLCDKGNLLKWNSVPNLEAINNPVETEEEVSFWKSHPYLNADPNKKFPMPKLKPLIPKQSASPECHIIGAGQKITQYTEFQMSSDFRDTIPTHNLGFVEKQILEEVSQKEMDAETRLRTLSYIFPQQQPTEISDSNLRHTYDCFDDMTHYDLSECQRQKGNQPPKNVSKYKSNLCFLPVLKPLRPDGSDEPRRKVRSSGRSNKDRGTKAKMESRKARETKKVDVCIKPTIKPSNVEDILKRLINFSKDYQKYFSELTTERETVPATESNVFKNVYTAPVKESPRLQYCKQFEESMESPCASITPMVGGVSSPINEIQLTNGDGGLNWPCKEHNGVGDELPFNIIKTGKRSSVEAPSITKYNSGEFMGVEEDISKTLSGIGDLGRLTDGNVNGTMEGIKHDESVKKIIQSYGNHAQKSEKNTDIKTNIPTANGFLVTREKEPSREEQSGQVMSKVNQEQKEMSMPVLPELSDTGKDNKFEERTLLSIPNGKEEAKLEMEKAIPTYASVVKVGEMTFQSNSVKSGSHPWKRNKPRKRSKRSSPPEEKTEPSAPRIRVSSQRQQSPVEKEPVAKPSNIFTLLPKDTPEETTTKKFIPRPPPRARSARINRPVNKAREVNQKSKSAASTDASAIDKSGIAGAIAKLSLQPGGLPGTEREAATSAQDDYIRRQNWEMGTMDYMGRDSFDNIWAKICETIDGKVSDDLTTGGEARKTETEAPPSSIDSSADSGKPVPEESKPIEASEKVNVKEKSEIEPQSVASEMGTGQADSDSPPRTIPEPAVDLPAKSVQALEAFGKLFVSGPIAIKSDVAEEVPQVQSESSGDVSVADAPARDYPQSAEQASTQRKKSMELSDEESKQKKGMLNKILELVGVSKPETAQSVFYDTEKPSNKDQSSVKEGQSVFYDVEVDQSGEEKKIGSSPAPVLTPEDQKSVVPGAVEREGSSDLSLSPSSELMHTMPDFEVVCQAPPPTPQTDEISDATKTTTQATEQPLQDISNESDKKILKVQLDSIIDEAERCVQKELEKSESKKGSKTDSQPEPSQSMALVPALEAFGKLFVSGPVCIKSEISEDISKLAVPKLDEMSKAAESMQEISKSDESVPDVLKPVEVTPALVTELQTKLSPTEVTDKEEDIPNVAEALQKEQLPKIQDSSPAEVKPTEILAKEASQEVRLASDKESARDISVDKQMEPGESSEKAVVDGSEKTDSAAAPLISKASEALEAFGKVFVSGPVILKSEIALDTDKHIMEPVQEKTEEVAISEGKIESMSIAVADEQKAEAIPTAETEEKKIESEPTVPPEQKKLGPEPGAKTVENEASPLPVAAAAEEKKSEPALATDKVPHTSPAVGEPHKTPEALEAFGKVFVSGPVVLKSEISEDTPRPDQLDAPEAVHRRLQEKSEEPIYCNIDEVEEIKVTSAEDRKKGKPMSSKLTEQILKAIPPTERKPFTEAAAAEEAETLSQLPSTVPQNISILTDRPIAEDMPVVEEEGASSSVPPVPPRRNRSKGRDAPQPPPKKKGKNGQS